MSCQLKTAENMTWARKTAEIMSSQLKTAEKI